MFTLQSIIGLGVRASSRTAVRCQSNLVDILEQVSKGQLEPQEAAKLFSATSQDETLKKFANLDHHRSLRVGFPEAVFAQGKTAEQVARILDDMAFQQNEAIETTTVAKTAILATRYERC
jgi:hypothetical protein